MSRPLAALATVLIITVGKSAAAFAIVRAFGHPTDVALTVSASLAQIGGFAFILIVLAADLAIVPDAGCDLVVAGAMLSIVLKRPYPHPRRPAPNPTPRPAPPSCRARPHRDMSCWWATAA